MLHARNILQDVVGLAGFPVGECKLEREGRRSQRRVWAGYRVVTRQGKELGRGLLGGYTGSRGAVRLGVESFECQA